MTPAASVASLPDADVLLIVPPFALSNRPSLGVHLLQACAGKAGFRVAVWYGNLSLAARLGVPAYQAVCEAPFHLLLGERLFSAAAYGRPPLGGDQAEFLARHLSGSSPS